MRASPLPVEERPPLSPTSAGEGAPLPEKVLIANRGEIACRIQRTLSRLRIPSVAVYSDADAAAPHVRDADEAFHLGPAAVSESYLRQDAILEIARATGSRAIHPGYGLLSENADFAAACEAQGVAFMGPTPEQIRDFGEKHRARDIAAQASVPLLEGSPLLGDPEEAVAAAEALGFPVLLKATAGGGGIGMRVCRDADEVVSGFARVAGLSERHFGGAGVFVERFIETARHVEIQIFGDGRGEVVALGARDCSLQRRRQKVIEEAPAPALSEETLSRLEAAALGLARAVDYRSAGTIEFLLEPASEEFFFLEANTRLQVEHGATEAVMGVDLVEWMVRLSAGDASPMARFRPEPKGHAIEFRLYAEDPSRDHLPSPGLLTEVHFPESLRVDSWVAAGTEITPFYDPLLAKLVAHAETREQAIAKLHEALLETRIAGVETNRHLGVVQLATERFQSATHHTRSLESDELPEAGIEVLDGGALVTVQDLPGRTGLWSVGVSPSGPMDSLAFALGNAILGNDPSCAGLEITMRGPTLRFAESAVVVVTGAPIDVTCDDQAVEPFVPTTIGPGQVLRFGAIEGPGNRSYLLVRGGLDVPLILGSRSTFTLGGFGGHNGRPLQARDRLPLAGTEDARDEPLAAEESRRLAPTYGCEWELAVLEGPHGSPEFFTDEDIAALYDAEWEVHFQSARTGVRLIGPKPGWARRDGGEAGLHPSNIHDNAYCVGSIDFTGDMPVILGPDGPSLGGFVCPAVVIEADRWKLGQLRAGDTVRFRPVSLAEADARRDAQRSFLASRGSDGEPNAPLPRHRPTGDGVIQRFEREEGKPELLIRASGDDAVLFEMGPMVLDLDLRVRVQLLLEAIEERRRADPALGIRDLTPGIRSLQVQYDPARVDRDDLVRELAAIETALPESRSVTLASRIVHLPLSWDDPATREAIDKYTEVVRDDAPWCPSNIEFIRRVNGLPSEDAVREIVHAARYLVLGLGDVYLGAPVATPIDPRHRLVTTKYNPARTWTPENAVGIGGAYLCIYGMEGPGGYQFVGRTLPVWDTFARWRGAASDQPWLLRCFDQIRFHPIGAEELLEQREAARTGRLEIETEETRIDMGEVHRFLEANADDIARFREVQREAFRAERDRWEASGELQAAERAAVDVAPEPAMELPEDAVRVSAPMSAQVLEVRVEAGDRVEAGQPLFVVSAMKTETVIEAPCAGTLLEGLARVGQVVDAGGLLGALLPDPDPADPALDPAR